MSTYRLEKLIVKEGSSSRVRTGRSIEGSEVSAIKYDSDEEVRSNVKLADIKEGDMVVVIGFFDYLKTSPIAKIISREKDEISFETDTSVYKLEKLNE